MCPRVIEKDAPNITQAQLHCLSHVLRNCAEALENFAYYFENSDTNITHEELVFMLKPTHSALGQVIEANMKGSFCALRPDQCSFVSPYIGCKGIPDCADKARSAKKTSRQNNAED